MDNSCFVKIEYDLGGKNINKKNSQVKINNLDNKNFKGKYLIGGGVYNRNSGCFVFKAKDIEEAKNIANNNYFIKQKLYEYKKLSVKMFI